MGCGVGRAIRATPPGPVLCALQAIKPLWASLSGAEEPVRASLLLTQLWCPQAHGRAPQQDLATQPVATLPAVSPGLPPGRSRFT